MFESKSRSLALRERAIPEPGPGQVLAKVLACGVCRTDLHLLDGELPNPPQQVVPGHEVVAEVVAGAADVPLSLGTRIGVPWLGWTCGRCAFCRRGQENLCEQARFTGYTLDGGYAEYLAADARYCFPLPDAFDDAHAAPLLCAGLIGYRAYRFVGDATRIGLYGFGAAAHILSQLAVYQGRRVHAFVRPGDQKAKDFALELGAVWAGESTEAPPEQLDAAIIFAPVGSLVPLALKSVRPGGRVVCAGIHMSQIPAFDYELLWRERQLLSVANLTRRDGDEFLALAERARVKTHVEALPLEGATAALERLRSGQVQGALVLKP